MDAAAAAASKDTDTSYGGEDVWSHSCILSLSHYDCFKRKVCMREREREMDKTFHLLLLLQEASPVMYVE